MKAARILLASHDTTGARAAEEAALALCQSGVAVLHLTVVPDLWRGMMGDDWLNNVSTREVYCRHIESQLATEIENHRGRLAPIVSGCGAAYRHHVTIGEPAECLLALTGEFAPDLVVIGSPRPPGTPGLRSRMYTEKLTRGLTVPLLIAPYPR